MSSQVIVKSTGAEDSGAQFMRRLTGNDGAAITQGSITGITVKVYDLSSPSGAVVYEATLTVSTVVFNTYQTDGRWTEDSTGYNFRAALPPSAFPAGDTTYQVEFLFDPASGDDFFVLFQHTTVPVRTS